MPKSKKKRVSHYNHHDAPRHAQQGGGVGKKMHTFSRLSSSSGAMSGKNGNKNKNESSQNQQQKKQRQHVRPTIPFRRRDRILLIGEGDFSFARSLAVHHRCKHILATCYDSKDTLHSKYPQAEKNIREFLGAFSRKKACESGTTKEAGKEDKKQEENAGQEERAEQDGEKEKGGGCEPARAGEEKNNDSQKHRSRHGPKVLYSVDARKLGSPAGGGKEIRTGFPRREPRRPAWRKETDPAPERRPSGGPWDIICFNFPHVGGLSTDVNRQVRANQELLVAFFRACVPLLSVPTSNDGPDTDESDLDEGYTDSESNDEDDDGVVGAEDDISGGRRRTEPGQILVTLFEGEPYTLWNIRDLARHAGLRVVTSFRFPWTSYPGYSHARTLGEIEGRHGGRGGWRGEEREARTYVFEVKTEEYVNAAKELRTAGMETKSWKKRAREGSDSDDSD